MACPMIHSVHYLACLPHTLYLAMIRHCVYKTGIRWTPVILSQILRHWFSLCFADASVKHDACYLFKNTVLLMKKWGLLIEFKSDDVMKITFLKYRICWDILKEQIWKAYLPKMCVSGQIVSEILAQLCSDYSIQILLNLPLFLTL